MEALKTHSSGLHNSEKRTKTQAKLQPSFNVVSQHKWLDID